MIPNTLLDLAQREFGGGARDIVLRNPYALCGVADWWNVDELGRSLGFGLESVQRNGGALCEGIAQVMAENGHTSIDVGDAERAAGQLVFARGSWDSAWTHLLEDELVVASDGRVQLAWMARVERELAQGMLRLAGLKFDSPSEAQGWAALRRVELSLSSAQGKAAMVAVSSGLSVLTGGPGCGKTSAVRFAVELADVMGMAVALCAPTHRAAGRLSDVVGRAAVTVHSLVGARVDGSYASGEIDADLVIVDEASLLDVVLAEALVRRLRCGARLMLVGDVDQLGSIGPGAVLRDLIESGRCAVTRLTEPMRQAAESVIVRASCRALSGRVPKMADFEDDPEAEMSFWDAGDISEIDESLVRLYLDGSQILTPRRLGRFGADQMSERLREQALKRKSGLTIGDLVRVRRPEYSWRDGGVGANVVGRVVSRRGSYGDRVATVDFAGQKVDYHQRDWGKLAFSLVSTVHAAQGSEWDEVAVLLHPSAGRLLNRQVLYTACTRAKKKLVVFGERGSLRAAVNSLGVARVTRLGQLLG